MTQSHKGRVSLKKMKKLYSCPKGKASIVSNELMPKLMQFEKEFLDNNFPAKSPRDIKTRKPNDHR